MGTIPLADLKPGSSLQHYYIIPDNFIVFSRYQNPSENDIERAKKFQIDSLNTWSDELPPERSGEGESAVSAAADARVQAAGTAASVPEADPSMLECTGGIEEDAGVKPDADARTDVIETDQVVGKEFSIYGNVVALLNREFASVGRGEKLETGRVLKIASVIVNYIYNVKEDAILHVSRGRNSQRLEVHAVNTAILAALTAQYLNIRGMDILNIVCGALLHDIGILFIPEGSPPEAVKEHTMQGFRYLKSLKNLDPAAVMPALQHHERANGEGYPKKLSLDQIEYSSRIVAICDSFDNQISFIKFGNDISIHFTKDELLTWKREDFDPQLFLAFISAVTEIIKKDSIVLLNSGELAVITKMNIRFPMNPFVQIVADRDGNRLSDGRVTDLIRSTKLWIRAFVKKTQ
jgi:HD-GYP domain-containing protein (c-di-GMP phosphodiesterase class II)